MIFIYLVKLFCKMLENYKSFNKKIIKYCKRKLTWRNLFDNN